VCVCVCSTRISLSQYMAIWSARRYDLAGGEKGGWNGKTAPSD